MDIKTYLSTADALLVSSHAHCAYLTSYFNFSPFEREVFLLITKTHHYLFTDARYKEEIQKQVPSYTIIELSATHTFTHALTTLQKKHSIHTIGIEENDITVNEYKTIKKIVKKVIPISLRSLRSTKNHQELSAIQRACAIGDAAFIHLLSQIKKGQSEKEVAHILELFVMQQGAALSFPSIIAFSKNSSVPHHHTGESVLMPNSIILLDFGIKYRSYCSDMTRTIFFGKADSQFKQLYSIVKTAQEKAQETIQQALTKEKPVHAHEIDAVARDYILSHHYPSIPHSLGHGIGIEVHEAPAISPQSKDIIKTGMVFSLEPGIYIPNYGGIRIEDLVSIEHKTVYSLTQSTKTLIEL